jgi:hypothetical protein
MSIVDQIATSRFGYKGLVPTFNRETITSTLHDTSDTLGIPKIPSPPPSQLSEDKSKDEYTPNHQYINYLPN